MAQPQNRPIHVNPVATRRKEVNDTLLKHGIQGEGIGLPGTTSQQGSNAPSEVGQSGNQYTMQMSAQSGMQRTTSALMGHVLSKKRHSLQGGGQGLGQGNGGGIGQVHGGIGHGLGHAGHQDLAQCVKITDQHSTVSSSAPVQCTTRSPDVDAKSASKTTKPGKTIGQDKQVQTENLGATEGEQNREGDAEVARLRKEIASMRAKSELMQSQIDETAAQLKEATLCIDNLVCFTMSTIPVHIFFLLLMFKNMFVGMLSVEFSYQTYLLQDVQVELRYGISCDCE